MELLDYRDVRSATLEQSLRKLGVEKLTKEDVQKMQWEALEGKIGNWIQYMRAAVSHKSFYAMCLAKNNSEEITRPNTTFPLSNYVLMFQLEPWWELNHFTRILSFNCYFSLLLYVFVLLLLCTSL